MEDKTFELIEKLYNRMEERFTQVDEHFAQVDERFAQVNSNMARMEHENAEKSGALFDGLKANQEAVSELRVGLAVNTEAIQVLTTEVMSLKKKVEKHEIKLKLVK